MRRSGPHVTDEEGQRHAALARQHILGQQGSRILADTPRSVMPQPIAERAGTVETGGRSDVSHDPAPWLSADTRGPVTCIDCGARISRRWSRYGWARKPAPAAFSLKCVECESASPSDLSALRGPS